MSASFTPGPWSFRQIDGDGLGYIEADGRDIMEAGDLDRPAKENIANGLLTAAAPDLYEALTLALGAANELLLSSADFPRAEIIAALARSRTGESS